MHFNIIIHLRLSLPSKLELDVMALAAEASTAFFFCFLLSSSLLLRILIIIIITTYITTTWERGSSDSAVSGYELDDRVIYV
jgi:hypothetical protein